MSATPGPWAQYEHDPLVIVNQEGSSIGDMKPGDPYIREAEALANAKLAATAPDLRDQLIAAERFIAGFEGDETQPGADALLTGIRTALIKAAAI